MHKIHDIMRVADPIIDKHNSQVKADPNTKVREFMHGCSQRIVKPGGSACLTGGGLDTIHGVFNSFTVFGAETAGKDHVLKVMPSHIKIGLGCCGRLGKKSCSFFGGLLLL